VRNLDEISHVSRVTITCVRTNITLKTAKLAQKHGVEMLIPFEPLSDLTNWDFASSWHQKMLPKLRDVYKGRLVVGSQKYHLAVVDYPNFDYSGYDYVGLGVDFDGFPTSWEKLRLAIRRVLDYADGLKKKYGIKIIISRVAFQPLPESMAIFEGYDEHPEEVKLRCYEMMFEEATGRVDGFFFYMWEYSVPTFLCLKRAGKEFIDRVERLPKRSERVFKYLSVKANFYDQRKRAAFKLGNPRLMKISLITFRHWKGTMEYHRTRDILYVKRLLGHKCIQNTLIYIDLEIALFHSTNDEFTVRVASNAKEACSLIESGFEYVTGEYDDGGKIFRKRK